MHDQDLGNGSGHDDVVDISLVYGRGIPLNKVKCAGCLFP